MRLTTAFLGQLAFLPFEDVDSKHWLCGSWEIPIYAINNAVLLQVNALFAKALVLKVSTLDGYHYQFGLQYGPTWEKQTALRSTIEESKITYSAFSIVRRLILVAWIIWIFVQWLT